MSNENREPSPDDHERSLSWTNGNLYISQLEDGLHAIAVYRDTPGTSFGDEAYFGTFESRLLDSRSTLIDVLTLVAEECDPLSYEDSKDVVRALHPGSE